MSNGNLDRRSILKTIGGSTAGAAMFGTVPAFAAADGNPVDFEIKELTGPKKEQAVSTARASDEFHKLVRNVQTEEPVRLDNTKAKVFEVEDPEGTPHQMVSFLMPGVGSVDPTETRNEGDVAAFLKAGSYYRSAATVTDYEGQNPVSVRTYETDAGSISTDSASVDLDVDLPVTSAPSGPIAGTDNTFSPESSGDVGTASVECWACKVFGDAACAIGCWAGTTVICGSLSIVGSVISGATCAAIGAAFCAVLTSGSEEFFCVSCYGDITIEWTCHWAGYCTKPDTMCNS